VAGARCHGSYVTETTIWQRKWERCKSGEVLGAIYRRGMARRGDAGDEMAGGSLCTFKAVGFEEGKRGASALIWERKVSGPNDSFTATKKRCAAAV
jgi:hypothetical protein